MRFPTLLGGACFLVAALLAAGGEPTLMRASKPEVRKQVVATIDAQLSAFRHHDIVSAYAFFAAELQAEKPLPLFATIVRANYPEFLTNTRAEYGIVHDDGTRSTVLVHVYGTQSDASYDYTLVREAGGWRVHTVVRHNPANEDNV